MRKFNIISQSFETGEYITALDLVYTDLFDTDISSIKVNATIKEMDHLAHVCNSEEIQREVTCVEKFDDKIRIHLKFEPNNKYRTCRVHPNSVEGYRLNIKDEDFTCDKIINPLVDVFSDEKREVLSYRLFKPNTDKAAPLVIWFHGIGEVGVDNRLQISNNAVVNWAKDENQKCFGENGAYIAAPQSKYSAFKPSEVKTIIDELVSKYNIDTKRIYVSGCSMGGYSTNLMISAYPDLFAAAIPVCPANAISEKTAMDLAKNNMPVYFVHCKEDPSACTVANSMLSVKRIREAGGVANVAIFDKVVTEFDKQQVGGHSVWIYVHNNFSGVGDNSQAVNFHKGDFSYTRTYCYYNDIEICFFDLYGKEHVFDHTDYKTWNMIQGEHIENSDIKLKDISLDIGSKCPVDLGYENLFTWLANQVKN